MKKLALILLSALLVISCILPAQAADVKALAGTPTIDGKLDEIYKQSGSLKVDNSSHIWSQGTGKTASTASSVSYFLHDDTYLYVCTVVQDTTIVDCGIKSGWQSDAVETWIKFPGAAKNSKISVDAFNTKIYGSEYTAFDKCKAAVVRDKTSYVTEVAIPLDSFKTGDVMPISIQINDFLAADAANGAAWGSQKADNNLTLSADKVVPPAAPKAAATADVAALAVFAIAASAAAFVACKKH